MLSYDIQKSWFSRLVRHLARKWSGSILTTLEPTRGIKSQRERERSIVHKKCSVSQFQLGLSHIVFQHLHCNYIHKQSLHIWEITSKINLRLFTGQPTHVLGIYFNWIIAKFGLCNGLEVMTALRQVTVTFHPSERYRLSSLKQI